MQTKALSPGPWMVLEQYADRCVFPIGYRQGPNTISIIAEVNSQGGTPDQARANADCMAAARELLEALEAMLEWARRAKLKEPNPGLEILNAINAIEKAQGK